MERPGYEEVVVSTSDGEQAITLRAAPWMRMRTDAPPSERYKQIILQGATELGLSESYLARLKAVPSAKPSAALTAIARAHGVVAVLLFRLKLRNALLPLRAASYALLRGIQTNHHLLCMKPFLVATDHWNLAHEEKDIKKKLGTYMLQFQRYPI